MLSFNHSVTRPYDCGDKETGQYYAVKVVDIHKLTVREFHMLGYELNILKTLCHNNVVKCVEIIESSEYVHIVMEHINGGELYEYLKKKNYFSEFETCYIVYYLLLGIEYFHSIGIMHRDLKPNNILIEVDQETNLISNVKITDFGLSCPCLNPLFESCGTPAYVAPEILRREKYGSSVDMWGLGVIIYLL